jgi:SanA protein
MIRKMLRHKITRITAVLLLEILVFVGLCNMIVHLRSSGKTFSDVHAIPFRKTGIVLGTSKYYRGNLVNPYFKYRIDAAAELYHAGKIKYLIVSGDNSKKSYNEPQDMKDALLKKGVPEKRIICDYAGLRTFDSIYRAWKIFGLKSFTIISQEYHNKRALYICQGLGLDAVAYNAHDVYGNESFRPREILARTAAVMDIWLGKKPKYLGEKIDLPELP